MLSIRWGRCEIIDRGRGPPWKSMMTSVSPPALADHSPPWRPAVSKPRPQGRQGRQRQTQRDSHWPPSHNRRTSHISSPPLACGRQSNHGPWWLSEQRAVACLPSLAGVSCPRPPLPNPALGPLLVSIEFHVRCKSGLVLLESRASVRRCGCRRAGTGSMLHSRQCVLVDARLWW